MPEVGAKKFYIIGPSFLSASLHLSFLLALSDCEKSNALLLLATLAELCFLGAISWAIFSLSPWLGLSQSFLASSCRDTLEMSQESEDGGSGGAVVLVAVARTFEEDGLFPLRPTTWRGQ